MLHENSTWFINDVFFFVLVSALIVTSWDIGLVHVSFWLIYLQNFLL